MLTRRSITHPQGQKFGAGDLVRATDPAPAQVHPDLRVGDLYRIVGSYGQRHRGNLSHSRDHRVYEITHVTRRVTFAWINEECLELVPEMPDFNPFKWVRAKAPW